MVVNLSGLLMQAAYLAFYYRFCRGSVSRDPPPPRRTGPDCTADRP